MATPSSNTDPGAMDVSAPQAAPAIHPTTLTTPTAAHQGQPQSQQPQRIPPQPVPYLARHRNFQAIEAHVTSLVIKEWVPCILSPAQVQGYLQDTRSRIQHIHALEAQRNQVLPERSKQLHDALFMAHLEYKVRFGRIFRINDLPPEILNDIFQYIIWVSEGPSQSVNWHLWLTWVCRHWREVALSDPTLWNAIWFMDIPKFERSFAYLDRSADAPLDIRINDTQARPLSLAEMQYVLNRVFEKISNLRIIILVLQEWDLILYVLHAFCAVKEKNIPMIMERFEMHRGGSTYVQIGAGHEYSSSLNPIPLFGGATVPSFKHLSLNGIHIDWANSALINLTNIDIRRIPLDKSPTLTQFRELFGRSPDLRVLFLDGAGPSLTEFIPEMPVKPVTIPSLRVLTLGDFRLKYALYLCSHLSMPNVLDLTMMNLVGEDYSKLFDALRSTMPLIRILTFHNIDFVLTRERAHVIIKWLRSMTQVTYFRVGFVRRQFLELFLYNTKAMGPLVVEQTPGPDGQTPNPDGQTPNPEVKKPEELTIPCPKLAYLEVGDINLIDLIIGWAHVRKQHGFPLRKVYLKISLVNKISAQQFQQLGSVLGSGGSVHFINYGTKSVEELMLMKEGEGIR